MSLTSLPDVANEPWRTRAACSGTDPELFFAGDPASVESARALCAGCPVRNPCLQDALALGEMHGVWGGMPEGQRRRLIRSRRRQVRVAANAA
jgi:WhiB family redox-sensing transcriptional regulator